MRHRPWLRAAAEARSIDWSDWGAVHQTLYCRCGVRYRAHAKAEARRLIARRACPGCGRYDGIWRARDDPQEMGLEREERVSDD